jgi:hypothetical protein
MLVTPPLAKLPAPLRVLAPVQPVPPAQLAPPVLLVPLARPAQAPLRVVSWLVPPWRACRPARWWPSVQQSPG